VPRDLAAALACAAGGVLGSWARHGVDLAVPYRLGQFPWATILINASGCLLLAALMVVLLEHSRPHPLLRPFLGVGVLGGYTTYSAFAVDAVALVRDARWGLAAGYVAITVVCCAVAVEVATTVVRRLGGSRT
jgi:CrcB protein